MQPTSLFRNALPLVTISAIARSAIPILLLTLAAGTASAALKENCEVHGESDPALCTYEPTTIGYTHDSDDTGFMDFTVSVRYQLFPRAVTKVNNWLYNGFGDNSALYAAFTGRFGQYIGTRDSAPVVEKLFNPKMFLRVWTEPTHTNYVDIAFAHQSNGQSIDSPAEYQAALLTTTNTEAVKDQLSRGWDYWEIAWKKTLTFERKDDKQASLSTYLAAKLFLDHGPFQGGQENYNSWENDPDGKRLDRVSGLSLMVKWIERGQLLFLNDLKVAARFETGVRDAFHYNTYRIEAGTKVLQLPASVWYQTGYNSDLAQYFKKVNSYGVRVEIGSF